MAEHRRDTGKVEGPRTRAPRAKKPLIFFSAQRMQGAKQAGELLRKVAMELLLHEQMNERELSLSLVDDEEIRKLNDEWRGKNKHTDVLSFPMNIPYGMLGDIVISLPTAQRQARENKLTLEEEFRYLVCHGLCHCEGYDHKKKNDAYRMAAAERRMLGADGLVGISLGLPEYRAKAPERARAYQQWKTAEKKRLKSLGLEWPKYVKKVKPEPKTRRRTRPKLEAK